MRGCEPTRRCGAATERITESNPQSALTPNQETEEGNRNRGVSNETIAKDSFVAMHADEITDHAESRQNHDVNGGVTVEPKKMLERD